jgi:hypothetical protein
MGDSQITKDRIPLKLTHCLMAQTALRPQIMFRAATARLPPEAISCGGCRADDARRALSPSGECASSDFF